MNKEASKRMFFGENKYHKPKFKANKKASLQACHKQIDPNSSDSELNPNRNI